MEISIARLDESKLKDTALMLTELMNYHRKLTDAPKKYWQTDEESYETIKEWSECGEVYNIFQGKELAGFFYIKLGGQNVAWLEDICVKETYRGKGIGKEVMKLLDEMLQLRGIVSMFVNVIPRNESAIKFYRECGFDHLNMIELRKNYDKELDKKDDVKILGFDFKKY